MKTLILLVPTLLLSKDLIIKNIVSIYDGDTFKVNLTCDEPLFCDKIGVRVYGVDTPEMKTHSREAKLAKEFTQQFLIGKIILNECARDKYFRINCKVLNTKGESLSNRLIEEKLGKPYFGGTKEVF
jgi:endonuclease YncB( thermonuclease family)